jgi:hypothetical protein
MYLIRKQSNAHPPCETRPLAKFTESSAKDIFVRVT